MLLLMEKLWELLAAAQEQLQKMSHTVWTQAGKLNSSSGFALIKEMPERVGFLLHRATCQPGFNWRFSGLRHKGCEGLLVLYPCILSVLLRMQMLHANQLETWNIHCREPVPLKVENFNIYSWNKWQLLSTQQKCDEKLEFIKRWPHILESWAARQSPSG